MNARRRRRLRLQRKYPGSVPAPPVWDEMLGGWCPDARRARKAMRLIRKRDEVRDLLDAFE